MRKGRRALRTYMSVSLKLPSILCFLFVFLLLNDCTSIEGVFPAIVTWPMAMSLFEFLLREHCVHLRVRLLLRQQSRILQLRCYESRESLHHLDVLVVKLAHFTIKLDLVDHLDNCQHCIGTPPFLDWDCQYALGMVARLPIDLLIEPGILICIRYSDEVALSRALSCYASRLWDTNLLARVCGDGPKLLLGLINQENSTSVSLNKFVGVHRDSKNHRLHAQVLRQRLHHPQQSVGSLASHYGGTVDLCIPQSNADVLRGTLHQDFINCTKLAKVVTREFVDGLQHTHAFALKVDYRHGKQILGLIATLLVKGLVKPCILVAIWDVHTLLRQEDMPCNALPRLDADRKL
mmetsp:Transcript_34086/g.77747  ORF Transcript_34086/g.77747 Transcript_34086/m.77747 type:complete len:349 (+) Transcript_34086:84-1130(+)